MKVFDRGLWWRSLVKVFGGGPLVEVFGGGLWWKSLTMTMIMMSSVTDPYHHDTDPDPGSKKFVTELSPDRALKWIRIQTKTIRIRIPTKKGSVPGKSLIFHALCVYIT